MIDKQLEGILKRVEKPARYIGGEINMVRKETDDVDLRVAFAFPDTYEIGMSYMGLQILYNILNENHRLYCERVFAPATDMEAIMRKEDRKLFTLETFTPLRDMDVIGFTLQYEMSYTNILNMLDLGGIPLKRIERMDQEEEYPIVIAGGPCAFNPEPLADFIDVFLIGDGEELLEKVCLAYADAKAYDASGKPGNNDAESRNKFLQSIANIDGVYVPEFYDFEYYEKENPEVNEDSGRSKAHSIKAINKLRDDVPLPINRALIADIETAEFPTKNIVPFIDTVHDRAVIETFRGCTRGCRFCQAGMIYRPVRERKTETITKLAIEQLKNTGHEELSLLSLSTSDYSDFECMATDLMKLCKAQNVALSLPSLRLDSFSFKVLNEIQAYRKSGLTFAPEAGTQRLRDVINKNINDEDIYSASRQAIELGWEHIKLYFMIGLPTESYEDLDGIAEIAKKIMDINYEVRGRKGGRFRVTVSVSNFVPKPHTAFQWERQNSPEEFIEKHNYLSRKLRIKGVNFNYHETATSNLEALFARGDRRCGQIIEEAWKIGCSFDAWTEHFNPELWKEALEAVAPRLGFNDANEMEDYYCYRERSIDEILPWDLIDAFITKDFLAAEKSKSLSGETTPDCRLACASCGMNEHAKCFVNMKSDRI